MTCFCLPLAAICLVLQPPQTASAPADERPPSALYALIRSTEADCARLQNDLQRDAALRELATAWAELGQAAEVRRVLDAETVPHAGAPGRLVAALAEKGKLDDAETIAAKYGHDHSRPHDFAMLARMRAARGEATEARRLLGQVLPWATDRKDWRLLADAATVLVRIGDREQAAKVFSAAVEAKRAELPSDMLTAEASLAERQARAGFHEEALKTAAGDSSAICHTAMAIGEAGDYALAKKAAHECDPWHGIWALETIALQEQAAGRKENVEGTMRLAEMLLARLAEPLSRDMKRVTLAETYAKLGRLDRVRPLLDEMESGERATRRINGLPAIAAAAAKHDRAFAGVLVAEVLQSIGLVTGRYEHADTLRKVALVQADLGQSEAAAQTLRSAAAYAGETFRSDRKRDSTSITLKWIATAQAKVGARDDAAQTFALAVQAGQETAPIVRLREVAEGQADAGFYAEAVTTAAKLDLPGARQPVYQTIATRHAAARGWAEPLEWVRKLDDPQERASALAGIAAGLAQAEQVKRSSGTGPEGTSTTQPAPP